MTRRYYHRKEFREQCRAFGLRCEFWNTRYGFTLTGWPDDRVNERYAEVLAFLRRELPRGTGNPDPQPKRGKPLPIPGHVPMTCRCDPASRVFVSRTLAERGGIRCDVCGANYEAEK